MTTAEMLASVEAQIRKDIPRLMELREGCKVKKQGKTYTILKDGDGYVIGMGFFLYKETILKNFEIIGHDITLADVLEWFRFLNSEGEEPFCYFTVDTNGNMIFDKFDEKTMRLGWNLKSPYLKDQSKELIEFLYNAKNQ